VIGAEIGTATGIGTAVGIATVIAGETEIVVQVKMTRYSLPKSRNGGGSKRRPKRPIVTSAPYSPRTCPFARASQSSSNSSARPAKCMMCAHLLSFTSCSLSWPVDDVI
jgi:hypothetical protein